MKNSEQYQELPFLEKDFAIWMDQLEGKLLEHPDWRELLTYQGISIFNSAYVPIYWGMLKAYRKSFRSSEIIAETQPTLARRIGNVLTRLSDGTMSLWEGTEIGLMRIQKQILMQMPRRQLPDLPGGKRVLVVRAFLNKSAFPVLQVLKKEGWTVLFASWNEKLEKPVKEIGIPYINLKNHYRSLYQNIFRKHQQEVAASSRNANGYLPARLLANLSGFPLKWNVYELLIENIVQVRTYIDIYLDLIEHYQPDIMILFNENSSPGRTMANVARVKGIPSVAIQHGLFIGHVYRNLATDKMIVWGEIPRKFWLERGCRPEQVISVGAIAHENWLNRQIGNNKEYTRNNDSKTVLVIGQNPAAFMSMEMHARTIDAVIDTARELPNVKFVIKPHPGESPSPYQSAIKIASLENVEMVLGGDIENYLLECDLVVTVFSTAGIEAMLLGRPVIVLSLSSESPLAPYSPVTSVVQHACNLTEEIGIILNNTSYRDKLVADGYKFVQEYLGLSNDSAATKAVLVISDMFKGSKYATAER